MEYEIYQGEKYKIIDAKEYAIENAHNCFAGIKVSSIVAKKGFVGQEVETIMKNGMKETKNIVSYDPETGEPDWIVAQATGEQMIVTDTAFKNLYYSENSSTGEQINPVPLNRPLIRVKENVAFMAPWGEMQYIKRVELLRLLHLMIFMVFRQKNLIRPIK